MFCLLPLLLVFSEAQARGYRGQGYGTTTGGWDEDGYGPLAKGCAINLKQGLKTVCVTYEVSKNFVLSFPNGFLHCFQ